MCHRNLFVGILLALFYTQVSRPNYYVTVLHGIEFYTDSMEMDFPRLIRF